METYRNDGIHGTDPLKQSGTEVESATLHVPVGSACGCGLTHPHTHSASDRSGIRGKIDSLKSQGASKVGEIQRKVSERSQSVKSNVMRSVEMVKSNVNRSVSTAKSSLRDETSHKVNQMQTSMRNSPMKWAGIAAGTGFGLGLIGRIVHWRNKHARHAPSLVVIERSC